MSSRKRRSRGISDAVEYFLNANTRQKFKGNDEMVTALELIENTSQTAGLNPEHIEALVDVAAAGIQIETVCKRLIKSLIPSSVVPEAAVLKCVSWLCTGKPSLNIQCLLLRWILVIYDYIDTRDDLHALYGVLFHFLHYAQLMPYACHLLYLLTRKEDVTVYRVRQLLRYQKDIGSKPFLTGLLTLYRHIYPDRVHVILTRQYKSFFPTYDRKWSAVVRKVREENSSQPGDVDVPMEQGLMERLQPAGQMQDLVPSRKRRKVDPIPVIHSLMTKCNYRKDRLGNIIGSKTVPFVLVHCFKDLLDNIESIEFPSQIGAVLRSESLKHLMSYTKDPVAACRFEFWLLFHLQEELTVTDKVKYGDRVSVLLKQLILFTDFLQEGIPVVDTVLSEYLQTWNGVDYCPLILKLVAKFRIYSFAALNRTVLEPFRRLFFCSSIYFKCKVIMCLTELLRNYAVNEWPRREDCAKSKPCLTLFNRENEDFSAEETLREFIKYMWNLILVGYVDVKDHFLYEQCALDFLELVSSMHKMYGVALVMFVETKLPERLLISSNANTVARFCMVVCRYKENFTSLKGLQVQGRQCIQMVRDCNKVIKAACNCLWRFRAYEIGDTGSLFHYNLAEIDQKLGHSTMLDSLSIVRHPAFLPFTIRYVNKVQLENAIDLAELKYEKKELLQHLDEHQLTGISQFIATFFRSRAALTESQNTAMTNSMSRNMSAFGF